MRSATSDALSAVPRDVVKASDVWSVCYKGNGWVSLEVDIISNLDGTCVKCEAFILVNNKTE
jgi:hypothetical protein